MKKSIVLALLMLSLSACGSSQQPEAIVETTTTEAATTEEATSVSGLEKIEAIGDVEVQKNLLTVSITVPEEYVNSKTQEDIKAEAEAKGYISGTLNADGSATYVMTKQKHAEAMQEMRQNINDSLAGMVGSEKYPNFTDIKANEDFTVFTITTKSEKPDLAEGFSVIGFYMFGGLYNIYNGTPVENIQVDFINADSGELISSSNSSDMGK